MTVVSLPTEAPEPPFDHLLRLSDSIGTFEHAEYVTPRRDNGYCTDDMARVVIVVAREPSPSRSVIALGRTAMRFLVAAQDVVGRTRNRRDAEGHWHGRHGVEDCWGRSLHAFGTAATRGQDEWLRQIGASSLGHAVQRRSPWPRAMAFAALGAAEMLETDPHHYAARSLLRDAVEIIGSPTGDLRWQWPEPRLSYANATVAEALLAAGHALERADVVDHGCVLLQWLLDRETVGGHLSSTPAGGSGPGDVAPGFDQQPIEAAAMADACARAESVTGDPEWGRGIDLAVGWFLGDNDAGVAMLDVETGGGYDGLHATGPNRNQGAESTLALISTLQHARARRLRTP
ncbi:MAG: hypothetical protein OSA99_05100 [Acidimicrobiales bacterium]|nr:hypothetical protein [Acidimicrobiales bacterium]